MAIKTPKATCLLCDGKYTKSGMTRHIQSCLPKTLENQTKKRKSEAHLFSHIMVAGYYLPEYWLHLKVKSDAKLKDLDQFLRDVWLECCGHLSAFRYKGSELKMGRRLHEVLRPGIELMHEYDFGTPTELLIKVFEEYEGPFEKGKAVQILARNEPPEIPCDACAKVPAVEICAECQSEEAGWLCRACAEDHECGEEMMLPVVNSPRVGECGYTGY